MNKLATTNTAFVLYLLTAATVVLGSIASGAERKVICLDGIWQIAEGTMDKTPERFDHKVPVPGLVDIRKVRGLDLSGRPWDNGWGPAAAKGDFCEAHPYVAFKGLLERRLVGMGELPGAPHLTPRGMPPWKPYIINEYGWLWLNRDGSPTKLTDRRYKAILGPGEHPVELYRETHARMLAAMTEFWRARRECAGVLHFCGLAYSRKDGYTCDNFVDINTLEFEPQFLEYVGDSFSPLAVMIDYWQIEHKADVGSVDVPVVVTSDLGKPWKGKLVLKLLRGDQVLQQEERPLSLNSLGQQSVKLTINFPKQKGRYRLVAELLGFGDKPVRSLRDIEVL